MLNKLSKLFSRIFIILVAISIFTGISSTVKAEDTVVIVNGEKILKQDLDSNIKATMQRYSMLKLDKNQEDEMKIKILESMINEELMFQYSKEFIKEGEENAKKRIDENLKQFGDETKFIAELKKSNLTLDQYRQRLVRLFTIQGYENAKIMPNIKITDDDITAHYQKQKLEVKASHILCKVEPDASAEEKAKVLTKIKGIQEKLKSGESFEELAKQNSDCPSGKQGGDLGFFGRGKMVKPFEKAAFNMPKGGVSDIVETQFGYHIIKVTDIQDNKSLKPMEEAKEHLKAEILQVKRKEAIKELLKKLKDGAKIKRF